MNELEGVPADYDYRTCHDDIYGGRGGYICQKEEVLTAIKEFVKGEENFDERQE